MTKRNRSGGWKYAKRSGHKNEDRAASDLENNVEEQKRLLKLINRESCQIVRVFAGGIHENDVPCILGDRPTKSKSDIDVFLNNGEFYGVSVKKSFSGQVYLIKLKRFIEGFETIYGVKIPEAVKNAMHLFWGDISPDEIKKIVTEYSSAYNEYEISKNRIVGEVLEKYNANYYELLLSWFQNNITDIFDFCFSRGLASRPQDWATIIWYKNEIHGNHLDHFFLTKDLEKVIGNFEVSYGKINGQTTIQLPFGFVQWHSPKNTIPGNMQFHHKYDKILALFQDYQNKKTSKN